MLFFTNLYFSLKKFYEYLTFPSKQYAKKFSKEYSKKYVTEYLVENNLKISPSPSLSSTQYAGETPPSPTYDYNKY